MGHRRQAPNGDRKGESLFGPHLVHEPANKQQPDSICGLKRENDPSVVDLCPAVFALKSRLENAKHLPIDIVDRGREKEEGAYDPSEVPDADCCIAYTSDRC